MYLFSWKKTNISTRQKRVGKLVIFTESADTLNYLTARLKKETNTKFKHYLTTEIKSLKPFVKTLIPIDEGTFRNDLTSF